MMHSPRERWRFGALAALAGVALLSACAGENLFSLAASSGALDPTVNITAPQEGFAAARGAAVTIQATVNSPNGLTSAQYSGVFTADGSAAYQSETEQFQNPSFANLNNSLNAVVNQGTGEASLIVRIVDGQGASAADTVKITIN